AAESSFVCLVGTGAPCDPATPTDNAIRDQRGCVRFLVVTTDFRAIAFWLFIRTRTGLVVPRTTELRQTGSRGQSERSLCVKPWFTSLRGCRYRADSPSGDLVFVTRPAERLAVASDSVLVAEIAGKVGPA